MALLAETLVEEWLNRQGYFTIRGARVGGLEVDLLAIRPTPKGLECRHIEVQASIRAIGHLTPVTTAIQKEFGGTRSVARARDEPELSACIQAWITKKYDDPENRILQKLVPGNWSRELVVNEIKHRGELKLMEQAGIVVLRLPDILRALDERGTVLKGAAGADLVDLVSLKTPTAATGA